MFKNRLVKRPTSKDVYFRPLLPSLLVFAALMVIIGLSWRTAQTDLKTQQDRAVAERARFVEGTIQQRFNVYENTLRASRGLFLSSDNVTRDEWLSFVNSLNLSARYPGIRGLGVIKIISADQKTVFEDNVRNDSIPDYNIYPSSNHPNLAPVLYVVPTAGQNITDRTAPTLGFDMYSDTVRETALKSAAQNDTPTLTPLLNLVTNNQSLLRGFYFVLPLYKKNMPLSSIAEKDAALDGFIYAPFATDSVFNSLFSNNEQNFGFTIYSGTPSNSSQIFVSNKKIKNADFYTVKQHTINLFGQTWTVVYRVNQEIIPYSARTRPFNVLLGGTIFAWALSLVIYLLIQRRTRSLAYVEQKKLEEAKDELLSLASHQLRTPATAVKQYVSMVKDGFAGSISSEQKKLLLMAYESNERQLTIVDDLLYVARIDAGQATLQIDTVNLNKLMESVIADQKSNISTKQQEVVFKNSHKALILDADPQYLRMILENLLSNASKYSYQKMKINIETKETSETVELIVRDKGVGIAEEDYPNMFQKFSRIPNELTRQIAGSGIGLYLARQLAILHGGDITFVSVKHEGSSFTLTMPKHQPKR
jgi:signal transduction histidine kinase